jgi:N-acylglucosamine-6-phosphate 2-epimerase
MERNKMIDKMKGGLIVSCQVQHDDPIFTDVTHTMMAKAAEWAGAVGIRANSPDQIRDIKREVSLPIIGLFKQWVDHSDVFITPNMEAVDAIVEAGADIIALDCTFQLNHDGNQAIELLPKVKEKYPDIPVFADVSNIEEATKAIKYGADIVAPTLYGYTKETEHIEGADYRMFAEFCRRFSDQAYVMMEGHVYTPEDAMKCIFLGAHAVVVGSAITRPHLIAKRFVDLLSGYQDNWREAEKAKH